MNRLFFLAFIFLGGCASLNKVNSTLETNNNTNEYNYSDPDSKIRYQITNDQKNIHIKLNSAELPTVMKILRSGLKICFDVKGKKNGNVYFQYPLVQNRQFSEQERSKEGKGQQRNFDLNKLVSQIPREAVFSHNGEMERILLSSTDCDIKVSIRAMNNDEIIYDVFIPISRISKEGISSLSKLSVGIVSGKNETTSKEGGSSEGRSGEGRSGGGRSGGGMSGGGRSGGGMSGGGRSGGGMSGGGRSGGGMSGEGRSGGMDRAAMFKPLEFWFKLDLQKN